MEAIKVQEPCTISFPSYKDYGPEAVIQRREYLSQKKDIVFNSIAEHNINPKRLRGVVENFIGSVQIPIGLAGPLKISGTYANGEYYAPFATVEGVITLSATRGATAINLSGGIKTKLVDEQMIRAPMFMFENQQQCDILIDWVDKHFNQIKEECEKLSSYGKLKTIENFLIGNAVHFRFCFTTGDAAGQNMVTIMTDAGCKYIKEKFVNDSGIPIASYIVEGNFAGDKKPNMINSLSTRGRKVRVEAFIKKSVMKRILKMELKEYYRITNNVSSGSALCGTSEGFSVNAANVIAALYAATGQDLGCIYESSKVFNTIEIRDDGLYWAALFPNIVTGTVSGSHRLPSQSDCIRLLECNEKNGANKLAEIIAGYCVALDLSTSSSICSGSFATAHKTWGRE
jgi:hydroxymethylglutaryl-CoA reductase (NADPH)